MALEGHTIASISSAVGKSKTTVKHHINRAGISTLEVRKAQKLHEVRCPRCGDRKPRSEFYESRTKAGPSPYCKICTNEQTVERQRAFKRVCIEYKGGACVVCKYSSCDAAMDFHHLDPNEKDFSIAQSRLKKFDDTIRAELDKCVLLCCRCHREVHAGFIDFAKDQWPN